MAGDDPLGQAPGSTAQRESPSTLLEDLPEFNTSELTPPPLTFAPDAEVTNERLRAAAAVEVDMGLGL